MMVMMNRVLILLLLLIASAACQDPMEPASSISKLRVLAIQADPPEVSPGEAVTHRVLYADPKGEGRDISFIWLTFLGLFSPSKPPSDGAVPIHFNFGTASDGGDVYEIPALPLNILGDYPAEHETAQAGWPKIQATTIVSICAGGESPDLLSLMDGTFSIGRISDLCVGGEGLLAFKTFWISFPETPERNTNLDISYISFNGNRLYPTDPETGEIRVPALTEDPAAVKCVDSAECPEGAAAKSNVFACETTADCLEGAKINAYLTENSFEKYTDLREEVSPRPKSEEEGDGKEPEYIRWYKQVGSGEQKDEAPYISWFSDGGALSLDRSRTAEPPGPFGTVWSPPQKGGTFTLYVAAHDLRGGTSWQQYTITAETGAGN